MTRFAFTSYQKILNKIRSNLRGEAYDLSDLLLEMQILDDQVSDLCPLVDKYQTKYKVIFNTE